MKRTPLLLAALISLGISAAEAAQIDFGFPSSDESKNWNSLDKTDEDDGSITFTKTQDGVSFALNVAGYNFTNDSAIISSSTQTNVNIFPNGAGVGVGDERVRAGDFAKFTISISSGADLLDSLAFNNLNIRYEGNTAGQDDRTLFDNSDNELVIKAPDNSPKGNYGVADITGAGLNDLTLATTNSWSLNYAVLHTSTDGVTALGQISFDYELSQNFVSNYTGTIRLGTGDVAEESYVNSPVTWDTTSPSWGVGPFANQSAWTNWIDGSDVILEGTATARAVYPATNLNVVVDELEWNGDAALQFYGISNNLQIITITNELRTALSKPARWIDLKDINLGGDFTMQNIGRLNFQLDSGVEAGTKINVLDNGAIAFNGNETDFSELTVTANGSQIFNATASDKVLGNLNGNGEILLNSAEATLIINDLTVGGISNVASFTANANSIGNLELGSGTHNFSLNPTTAAGDQLAIGDGTITYGGDLIVLAVNTNIFKIGDSFKLFSAGSYTGAFSFVELPTNNLPEGAEFYTDDLSVDGSISVGEPGVSYKSVNFTDFLNADFLADQVSTAGSITNGNTIVTLTLSVGDFPDTQINNYTVGLYGTAIQGLKGGPAGKSDFRHDSGLTTLTDDDEVLKLQVSISSTEDISTVVFGGLNVTDATAVEITDFMDGSTNITMTGSARVTPSDTLSALSPLSLANVGGLGDDSWFLEIAARDIPGVTEGLPASRVSFDNITINYGIQVESSFNLWTGKYGLEGDDAADEADPDMDGINNLYEYGLNGDPTNAANRGQVEMGASNDGSTFIYIYPRRTAANSGIDYSLATSTDLVFDAAWTNNDTIIEGIGPELDGFEAVTNSTATDLGAKFIQLFIKEN